MRMRYVKGGNRPEKPQSSLLALHASQTVSAHEERSLAYAYPRRQRYNDTPFVRTSKPFQKLKAHGLARPEVTDRRGA